MRARSFVQTGVLAALWLVPSCASGPREVNTVPPCAPLEEREVPEAVCDERELARYTDVLSERLLGDNEQALVRVEFDDAARVRSVCVDEGTGRRVWKARREIAERLLELGEIPPGPQCLAGARIDLNRYEAKLAETKRAQNRCQTVSGARMKALRSCEDFAADWILYDRLGSTRPYLFVRSPGVQASAARTVSRCGRTGLGFDEQSRCIEADGFELIKPPER